VDTLVLTGLDKIVIRRDRAEVKAESTAPMQDYHLSQCSILSSGSRVAGLKSVPSVYPTGMSEVCMTSS